MPSQEIGDRVYRRLEELYRRHLSLHDEEVVGYYESGVGYYKPGTPQAEQKPFSICLATTDGEVFVAGDHEHPFALLSDVAPLFGSVSCPSARALPNDPAWRGHLAPGAGSLIPRLRNACRNAWEKVAP